MNESNLAAKKETLILLQNYWAPRHKRSRLLILGLIFPKLFVGEETNLWLPKMLRWFFDIKKHKLRDQACVFWQSWMPCFPLRFHLKFHYMKVPWLGIFSAALSRLFRFVTTQRTEPMAGITSWNCSEYFVCCPEWPISFRQDAK